MATSSNFSTDNTYIKYRIIANEDSYSVANNTSQVTVKVQVWRTNQGYETSGSGTCYVTIDGTSYSQAITNSQKFTYNSYTEVFSKTVTISHDANGTKSIYISSYISHSRFTSSSQGFTVKLTDIPRNATITKAPDFTDIQNPTITYSNSAGATATSLQACISLTGNTDDIKYRDISKTGTSYTFNLTDAERNVLRQATTTSKSRTVYFYIRTIINGVTFYANKSVTLTIVEANPTFSVAYLDTNSTTTAITSNNQQIIQNNSTLQINITNATALKYASLTSASINVNGTITTKSLSSSSITFDVGTINVSQNLTLPVTVTDSRGYTTTINLSVQVLAWSLPTAIINLARESNFYTKTDITVNAEYSILDSKNTITIQYQIKKTTDTSYGSLTTIENNVQSQFDADNNYSWNVKVILTDKIGSTTYNLFLYKGIPLMYWDRILSSIGINCFPANQYSVESSGLVVDDIKYIGSQVLYDSYTMTSNGKNAVLGSYNYDLINGLFNGITIPSSYERAYRVTAQISTTNNNQACIYLNNIKSNNINTWSNQTMRKITSTRIFKESEITLETTYGYTKQGCNIYCQNNSDSDNKNAYFYNITVHGYLVKNTTDLSATTLSDDVEEEASS